MAVSALTTRITKAAKPPKHAPTNLLPRTENPIDALLFYHQTLISGRYPDKFTLISTIKACTAIEAVEQGKAIHARIVKTGFSSDRFLSSALVRFYSASGRVESANQVFNSTDEKDTALRTALMVGYIHNGDIESARQVFDEMPERDLASWNAMISGYARIGMPMEAIHLFREMQSTNLRPNEITLVSALSACSQLGCLAQGLWIHTYMDRNPDKVQTWAPLNALVNMYAKSGKLDIAYQLFIQIKGPGMNLESWNTMLTGFAIHGCGMNALSLFSQMIKLGLEPDRITFLGLLMAFNHGGMVDHAYACFDFMTQVHGLEPGKDHYGCLVGVLSRAGLLDEACMVMENMPYKPDAYVYGGLLGGCLIHGNSELGIKAATRLLELEPNEQSRYLALANLYAMAGKVEEAAKLREAMVGLGIKKSSGSSAIEVEGVVHEFLAGDRSHDQSQECYSIIELITQEIAR